jgi:hypothetical protein
MTEAELETLYAEALNLIQNHVTPPPILDIILNPTGWIGDWVRDNPNEAQALARKLQALLDRHLG